MGKEEETSYGKRRKDVNLKSHGCSAKEKRKKNSTRVTLLAMEESKGGDRGLGRGGSRETRRRRNLPGKERGGGGTFPSFCEQS